MKRIVITTHGRLCEGLLDTLSMFTSDLERVSAISLTTAGMDDYEQRLRELLDSYADDELLVLVDILGGSPFQTVMRYKLEQNANIEIVHGVNFPMCLEATLGIDGCSISELATKCVNTGKTAIEHAIVNKNIDVDDE